MRKSIGLHVYVQNDGTGDGYIQYPPVVGCWIDDERSACNFPLDLSGRAWRKDKTIRFDDLPEEYVEPRKTSP